MAIWMTDVGFLIDGKYSIQIMGEYFVNLVTSQVSHGLIFNYHCFEPTRLI